MRLATLLAFVFALGAAVLPSTTALPLAAPNDATIATPTRNGPLQYDVPASLPPSPNVTAPNNTTMETPTSDGPPYYGFPSSMPPSLLPILAAMVAEENADEAQQPPHVVARGTARYPWLRYQKCYKACWCPRMEGLEKICAYCRQRKWTIDYYRNMPKGGFDLDSASCPGLQHLWHWVDGKLVRLYS